MNRCEESDGGGGGGGGCCVGALTLFKSDVSEAGAGLRERERGVWGWRGRRGREGGRGWRGGEVRGAPRCSAAAQRSGRLTTDGQTLRCLFLGFKQNVYSAITALRSFHWELFILRGRQDTVLTPPISSVRAIKQAEYFGLSRSLIVLPVIGERGSVYVSFFVRMKSKCAMENSTQRKRKKEQLTQHWNGFLRNVALDSVKLVGPGACVDTVSQHHTIPSTPVCFCLLFRSPG